MQRLESQQSVRLDQRENEPTPHRSISITVDFEMRPGDEGVLIQGGNYPETYSLEVRAGRLVAAHQRTLLDNPVINLSNPVPTGPQTVRYEFNAEAVTDRAECLLVNGKAVPRTDAIPAHGQDFFPPDISFTGIIRRVAFNDSSAAFCQ